MYFLWLLDAHTIDRAMGVPEDVFKAIFYICAQCGRYMTQRVSFDHHDDSDDWDSEDFNSKHSQCIYLRATVESEREGTILATTAPLLSRSGLRK